MCTVKPLITHTGCNTYPTASPVVRDPTVAVVLIVTHMNPQINPQAVYDPAAKVALLSATIRLELVRRNLN